MSVKPITLVMAVAALLLAGCGSSSSSSSGSSNGLDLPLFNSDSAAVQEVKGGVIKACPTSTLGEMADAFFGAPTWRDFTSTKGDTVVEVSGMLSYKGSPTTATIQFLVDPLTGFEASYVEIGGNPGSLIELSALLKKMCEAT